MNNLQQVAIVCKGILRHNYQRMAKPALGRGLGNLLGDTRIAANPEPATVNPETANTAVSPGLGNLLTAGRNGGAREVAEEQEVTTTPVEEPQDSKPASVRTGGLASQDSNKSKPVMVPTPQLPEDAPIQAPRWVLLGADLLLVILAALLVYKSPVPLKPWEMTICLAAVMLGAVLACVAVLSTPKR